MLFRSLSLVALLAGCAASPHPKPPEKVSLPRAEPVTSDDEYGAARAEYDALPLGAADRAARRAALEAWLLKRVRAALDGKHNEEAWDQLKQVLTLWDAEELRQPVEDAALLDAAARVERAYRPRGAHQEVLATLVVQISLARESGPARERYRQVTAWLRSGGNPDEEAAGESADGRERVVEDLEAVAKLWPSPFVVGELTTLYFEPGAGSAAAITRRLRRGADLRELLAGGTKPSVAYDVARLYLRISQPAEALEQVKKLKSEDAQVRGLLERVTAPGAQPLDALALARYFTQQGRDDRDVAARICRDAARKFPAAPEPRLCAGELALQLDQLVVAIKQFEEALKLDPARREPWEALAQLYQARLYQLVSSDENLNIDELERQLKHVEAFHAEAKKRFTEKPLRRGMAGVLFEVGRGYYNAGRLTEAVKYLERSLGVDPTVGALELYGQIRLKKGLAREAAALFEKATQLPQAGRIEELYWRAKLRRHLGDAFEGADDKPGAETIRKAALADWDVFLGFPVEPEFAAEAWVEKGKLLYQLGERDDATNAFGKAIDTVPDRGSTYADVIAFLVPRGEHEEALDAYHRALGRSEVTDYLKVYCSLWMVDLLKRAGQPEDPLATAYLKSTDGGKWFDELARWATGRATEEALVKRADTPGRKAEAAFYRAMRALSRGEVETARALWREVIATDMMAYFEYDMALMYLKMGSAPSEPVLKSKPRTHKPAEPAKARRQPDGSI